jgi:hypothetical protein
MNGWPHRDRGCGLGCAAFGQHENHTKVAPRRINDLGVQYSKAHTRQIQMPVILRSIPKQKLALGFLLMHHGEKRAPEFGQERSVNLRLT